MPARNLVDFDWLAQPLSSMTFLEARDGIERPLRPTGASERNRRVVGGVAGHAEGLALQEVRPEARLAVGEGALGGFVHGEHVIAVDDFGGHSIPGCPVGNVGDRHLEVQRGGVCVLIVVADVDHRQLLDAGEVDPFVPVAAAGGAVAEVAEGDMRGSTYLKARRRRWRRERRRPWR
jgi:hypothetical protein